MKESDEEELDIPPSKIIQDLTIEQRLLLIETDDQENSIQFASGI